MCAGKSQNLFSRERRKCTLKGKRWHSIIFKDAAVGHLYEDKSDSHANVDFHVFHLHIRNVFIHLPLTLTNQSTEASPSFLGTKWKYIITILHPRPQKTQNGNASIDKFIIQSECTNSRFHHLAHQQLFPMNYLWAPLLPCLSSPLDVVKPIKNL